MKKELSIYQSRLSEARLLVDLLFLQHNFDFEEEDIAVGEDFASLDLEKVEPPRMMVVNLREVDDCLDKIKEIRSQQKFDQTQIVVYSAYSSEEYEEVSLRAGANLYISKGIDSDRKIIDEIQRFFND